MNFLDRLNLRPNEKRLVVVILIVLFVVLNVWFVWPQFKQWNLVKADLANQRTQKINFQDEIDRAEEYKKKEQSLRGQGSLLLPEEAAVQLRRTIDTQTAQSGLVPNGINDQPSKTAKESIFEERAVTMGFVNTGEKELVDFLYNISKDRSTIRVRDLSVRPDSQLQKLQGSMTLVATYQKKSAAAKAEPATKPVTPAKPAEKPAPAKKDTKPETKPESKPAPKAPAPAKTAPAKAPAKSGAPPPPPPKTLPNSADIER